MTTKIQMLLPMFPIYWLFDIICGLDINLTILELDNLTGSNQLVV